MIDYLNTLASSIANNIEQETDINCPMLHEYHLFKISEKLHG